MAKLCVFGDSIMKGVIYDGAKKKYSMLKDSFANSVSKIFSFSTDNFAKFGCTVTKGLEIAQKHISDIENSDYVALEFGGNDSDFNWEDISDKPDAMHHPKTTIKEYENNYMDLISTVKSAGGQPLVLNLPPLDAQKYFNWIIKGLNKENILKWLGGSEEYIYRWHEMYNMSLCKLTNKTNVPLIDIRSIFLEKHDYKSYFCIDGIHPNEQGHALIVQAIEDFAVEHDIPIDNISFN